MLARVWHEDANDRRAIRLALIFAVLFRLPLALAPVGADSDMVRYLWDGRVQQRGYNPYAVVPSDPAMAATHTSESERMPSRHARTPYPPAAQLFFRLVVGIHDSTLAMKLALVVCDMLTIVVLSRWLIAIGLQRVADARVCVESVRRDGGRAQRAHRWPRRALARRRCVLADEAPDGCSRRSRTCWPSRRNSCRSSSLRSSSVESASGTRPSAWHSWRFSTSSSTGWRHPARTPELPTASRWAPFPTSSPTFASTGRCSSAIASVSSAPIAAAVAVVAGLGAAVLARWQRPVTDPAAWAWPMAVALACAPVIYPWYLLYLTPFLWTRATLPLLGWCFSGLTAYVVWDLSRHGGRWICTGRRSGVRARRSDRCSDRAVDRATTTCASARQCGVVAQLIGKRRQRDALSVLASRR